MGVVGVVVGVVEPGAEAVVGVAVVDLDWSEIFGAAGARWPSRLDGEVEREADGVGALPGSRDMAIAAAADGPGQWCGYCYFVVRLSKSSAEILSCASRDAPGTRCPEASSWSSGGQGPHCSWPASRT